jgi:hypothetical protein
MARATYSEKLRDPRWQKKRLEIMQRDNFTCQRCQSTADTLAVHHLSYERGKAPWDYPNEVLVTLCEHCHTYEREQRPLTEKALLLVLSDFMVDDLEALSEAMSLGAVAIDPEYNHTGVRRALERAAGWETRAYDAFFASQQAKDRP